MIDPRFILRPKVSGTLINADLACRECDYNVKGLRTGDRCPECGTPIRQVATGDDVMSGAPVEFLRRLALGAWALATAAPAGALLLCFLTAAMAYPSLKTSVVATMYLALCAAFTWGVFTVTAPPPSRTPGAGEVTWAKLRLTTRITQSLWAAGATIVLIAAIMTSGVSVPPGSGPTTPSGPVIGLCTLGAIGLLVAFVGLIPLSIYLSFLADWAQDPGLGNRLRLAPFLLAASLPFGIVTAWLSTFLGGRWIPIFVIPLVGVLGAAFLVLFGFFVVPVIQFANTCSWAVRNAHTSHGRDRRIASKIVRRVEEGRAKAEPTPAAPEAAIPIEPARTTPSPRTDRRQPTPRPQTPPPAPDPKRSPGRKAP